MSRSRFSRSLTIKRGPSLYDILEVSETANQDEIRRNYRRLAFRYHPDKNPNNPEAADKFKGINKAYSILSNDEKKHLYDEFGDVGLAFGTRFGDEKAKETCQTIKANPCFLCMCGLCSILTCCWCCLCCCFCCCCCGQCEEESDVKCDLNDLGDEHERETVTTQPKTETVVGKQ